MKIVAYCDESGTHDLTGKGKGSNPCVCGYIATVEYWAKFRQEWGAVLNAYTVPYFHFRELNKSERSKPANPHHGWDDERADDFIHDLAIIAGREAVPFGGNESFRHIKQQNRLGSPYTTAFERFFNDFDEAVSEHWPTSNEPIEFVFEQNTNSQWLAAIRDAFSRRRKKDKRIGEMTFSTKLDPIHGVQLQAADMIAYANRQVAERTFEEQKPQHPRILDLILFKNAHVKGHPQNWGAGLSPGLWEHMIKMLREDRKMRDITNVIMGLPKAPYYPLIHHPLFNKKR